MCQLCQLCWSSLAFSITFFDFRVVVSFYRLFFLNVPRSSRFAHCSAVYLVRIENEARLSDDHRSNIRHQRLVLLLDSRQPSCLFVARLRHGRVTLHVCQTADERAEWHPRPIVYCSVCLVLMLPCLNIGSVYLHVELFVEE